MALSLEKFAASLAECGVLSEAELSAFCGQHSPADSEQLARALVKQKLLTAYQAQQAYAGKSRALVLGNYVILDKLGQGGMGMVLKARHRRMDRIVALKVLSPTVIKTPDLLSRFHREVKAAAKLQHPNIVMAFDADEANSTHFLVMEYVEGADLSALIKKSGPLPLDQAIRHITQAARGLEFAHKHGVIHRDIKPANLLLDAHGTVKILDMGLARIEGETGANAELTSTGAVMGTVDYMAPEQALSTKTADARSDVYSLGITLWYLLTARPAYEGDSLMARLMAHANNPVPSLKAARADIPDGLDAVYQRMVAKKPTDRFQTMSDVLAALETCRGSGAGDSRTIPGGSTGPSEDSKLSEMLALFGGGADSSAVTRTITAAQKGTDATRPTQGSEFEKTVTSGQPDAETDPTTLTSLRKTTGPQRKCRTQEPKWWQDKRIQIGGGLAALLLVVVAIVATRNGDSPPGGPAISGAKPADVAPIIPTPPRAETTSAPNSIPSPQPGASAAPQLSLAFDGTIRARVPSLDVDRTKPFTIEAWATPQADYPNGSGIVFLTPACGLAIGDGRWIMRLETVGVSIAEKPLQRNRRVHVAGVRSEKELILFVDGVVVARSPVEPKPLKEPANFYIGTFLKYGYKGLIDEVRVSSGVRYPKEFTPTDRFETDDQTIALYHFDEGQGSDFRDSSGNGYHGFVDNEKFERVSAPVWVRVDSNPTEKPRYPKDKADLPDGFTPLFNGKDLTGWKGQVLDPKQRAAMSPADLSAAQAKADELMRAHWSVQNGVLNFDGQGDNLCTARDYADFELYLEWKIEAGGDTGIYLRGCPQVQIWDSAGNKNGDNIGSGGLFNNQKHPNRPRVNADNPIGQWNAMLIRMVGEKATISLNGQLVVDDVVFENSFERDKPIYPTGPIELQKFGAPVQFRNMLIRELNSNSERPKDSALSDVEDPRPTAPRRFGAKEWIDVIPLIDPALDKRDLSITGKNDWRLSGHELKYVSDDKGGFLLFPLRYRGRSIEFELDFTRTAGPRNFIIDIPYANTMLPLHIDKPGSEGGIYISKYSDPQAELIKKFRIVTNKRTKLGFRITRDGLNDLVELSIDGQPAGQWSGDLAKLSQPTAKLTHDPGERNGLYITSGTDFTFHSIRIRMLDEATAETLRPVAGTNVTSRPASDDWEPLFDGKTLNGWEAVGEGGWSAADGVLKAAGTGKGWIGTTRTFQDYELELEYRIQAQGNGGIALRAWKEGGISAKPFFEVQILDDAANPNIDPTGSIPGHVSPKPGFKAPLNEWNKITVRLEGKHALVTVNGATTVDADLPIERVEGMIGLQVWDRPVEYRNIRAREVRKRQTNGPPHAIAPFDSAQARSHQAAWASHLGMTVETTNSVGAKMVLVPPGEFLMGSTDAQIDAALKLLEPTAAEEGVKRRIRVGERPQHRVVITKPFLMGATEVTIGQFKQFSASGYQTEAEQAKQTNTFLSYGKPVTDDTPAAFISWNDAAAYCRWLSKQETASYRLPTEAEWEYACRAGTVTQFSFGDDAAAMNQFAWYKVGESHAVGGKLPNAFGLHDMHGNLEEWCQDYYGENQYALSATLDPMKTASDPSRVSRGGHFGGLSGYSRSAGRNYKAPSSRYFTGGFRVVRELESPPTDSGINLLSLLDLKQDRVPAGNLVGANNWTVDGSTLTYTSDGKAGKVMFPVSLNDVKAFEVEMQVKRLSGNGVFTIDLPVSESIQSGLDLFPAGRIELGMQGGKRQGIGQWPKGLAAEGLLKATVRHRPDGTGSVDVTVDGLPAAKWDGALSQMGKPLEFHPDFPGERVLSLFCFRDSFAFTSPTLRILEGSARPLRKAVAGAPSPAVFPFDAAQARAHQEAWARRLGTSVETINSVGAKMIIIPPGDFQMGSTDEQVAKALKAADETQAEQGTKDRIQISERPQHRVVITKPFLMAATETTSGQFRKFAAATNHPFASRNDSSDDLPVSGVAWDDAAAYCKWLSEQENTHYRLPTEAEWEYACRAGTTTQFSFGDDQTDLDDYGWSIRNSNNRVHPAGEKKPNAFGLFDMHGNVLEWCGDFASDSWYAKSPVNDPLGPSTAVNHMLRGGWWRYGPSNCRSAYRENFTPRSGNSSTGFRIVRVLTIKPD
jgi:formylglycine-generating enzyme required for sulfatase activity/serine/threonine protein kinase